MNQTSTSITVFQKDKPKEEANETPIPNFQKNPENLVALTQRQRLKLAVRDYGSTVVIFHVTISLASLGICYLAVSSGLDVVAWLSWLGVGKSILESRLATGASTFVISYAVHKVFAPVRIGITLTCTPLIVRYLRRVGFLKAPQKPQIK
ncbi:hypothetical protein HELRODRAFT_78789 [Helobdella robusta]|uniref:DUF1279 domain-containing protein n=1 Tax=Helobdella robusta TaxID=6412 RepID=T1G3F9_HELRO|nr:hypothetical protein HELRODRAFT_78789 [Helobdella robusta]ESO04579.1 hypothetical protein HELRODRAFT_78789 [Helobdella robusta]